MAREIIEKIKEIEKKNTQKLQEAEMTAARMIAQSKEKAAAERDSRIRAAKASSEQKISEASEKAQGLIAGAQKEAEEEKRKIRDRLQNRISEAAEAVILSLTE